MNIAQVIVTSMISTAELGIIAIGLTMTFSILRFANFSHASMAVIGAYIAYTFNVRLGLALWAAFAAAMLLMGCFGIVVDRVISDFITGAAEQLVNVRYFASIAIPTLWRGAVQIIPGAGHTPQWETPEAFDALLAAFIEETA